MVSKFNVGDVVKLKSGGPSMTVTGTHDKIVYVTYFDTYTGSYVPNEFDYSSLVKIRCLNVIKVGNDNLVPSQEDLKKVREVYENALKDKDVLQFYQHAVSLERWEIVEEG